MNIFVDYMADDKHQYELGSFTCETVPQVGDNAKVKDNTGTFQEGIVDSRTFDFRNNPVVIRISIRKK